MMFKVYTYIPIVIRNNDHVVILCYNIGKKTVFLPSYQILPTIRPHSFSRMTFIPLDVTRDTPERIMGLNPGAGLIV